MSDPLRQAVVRISTVAVRQTEMKAIGLILLLSLCALAVRATGGPSVPPAAADSPVYPATRVDRKPVVTVDQVVQLPSGLSEAVAFVVVVVELDGSVSQVQLVKSSDSRYGERALTAAKKLRFQPAQKEGHAVRCATIVPFANRIRTQLR